MKIGLIYTVTDLHVTLTDMVKYLVKFSGQVFHKNDPFLPFSDFKQLI